MRSMSYDTLSVHSTVLYDALRVHVVRYVVSTCTLRTGTTQRLSKSSYVRRQHETRPLKSPRHLSS